VDKEDKRTHIKTIQSLQRDINSLKEIAEKHPKFAKTIETLRNSQDKLCNSLIKHGITAEEVYKIIMENNDKTHAEEIIQIYPCLKAFESCKNSPYSVTDE